MKQEPGRRVVSKSEFLTTLGGKVSLALLGAGVVLMGLFGLGAAILIAWLMLSYSDIGSIPLFIFFFVLIGGLSLVSIGRSLVKEAKRIETGIPLTHANTANLPVADSLVRASSESLQSRKTVLLRAAMETMQGQKDELLRASGGKE